MCVCVFMYVCMWKRKDISLKLYASVAVSPATVRVPSHRSLPLKSVISVG